MSPPTIARSSLATTYAMAILHLFLLCIASFLVVSSSGISDTEILLKFKDSLIDGNNALGSWNKLQKTPCDGDVVNWVGVYCENGKIWDIQLENKGLSGTINVDVLQNLPYLRRLSFMKNNFGGPMPQIKKLGMLRSIYLSNNHFSGEIPGDAFQGMMSLKKVYLAENNFTGAIPLSLTTLPKLLELRLDDNKFNGSIPEFRQDFSILGLSNNALTGLIPAGLIKMDPSSFAGNKGLCGNPLSVCDSPPSPNPTANSNTNNEPKAEPNPNPNPNTNTNTDPKKSPVTTIVIVAVVAAVAILAMIVVIFMIRRKKQPSLPIETPPSDLQKKSGIRDTEEGSHESSNHNGSTGKKADQSTKLSFVRDDREKFDLQDMLKASAEILGSGCFGSSYKAALLTGSVMVVKRFKQMNNVGREEFQEHMRRLGRLKHPNLLPLVAYYYRKEEKLLISDFVQKGSLAVHLHGYQALGQPSLDWPTRLKIIKGVAKGLQYLYKELPSLIAPHGHIKSSNVLLSENLEPLLTDYGLIPVINQESSQELMVAYKSPEYLQHDRVTKKTDVWGLGIMILEISTGKFPANFLQKGKANEEDLATWVKSVFHGEWTSEVFDKEMASEKNSQGEMLKLLKIGLSCCEVDVEKRLDLKEAVERIEELKEKDGDGDEGHFYSSHASDQTDGKSSRG